MRSNIRIFEERGITAAGKILSADNFRLLSDIGNPHITDEAGKIIVSKAESMLDEEIPLLPLSLYLDFFRTGVRSRFQNVHHRRRTMLLYLTLAEKYEHKGRFIDKLIDVLWAILEETTWVLPAHSFCSVEDEFYKFPEVYRDEQERGIDLYAANCSATVALTKYLLKEELDAVSPVICRRIDHLVIQRGIMPYIGKICRYWAGENGAQCDNWVTNITSNVLFAAAVCSDDTEIRTRVVDRAMHLLDNYTSYFPADGCCEEGPGYWGAGPGNYFDCLEQIEELTGGAIKVYDHPLVNKMGEYIIHANINGNYYLNFADAKPFLEQDGKLLIRYGQKCHLTTLETFGKAVSAANNPESPYHFNHVYRTLKDVMTPRVLSAEYVPAQRSKWFDETKVAIFRESRYTDKGLYLAVKGGCNDECHNHNDVGCIVISGDGKPLIVDPSHGSYDNDFFGETRYKRWFMSSSGHSIPTVDGFEEGAGRQFASCDEIFDEAANSITMELKNAFPAEAGILSMRRTCKLDADGASVTDDVRLDHTGDIRFQYLCCNEPVKLSDGRLKIGDGAVFAYDPVGVTTEILRVENTWLPYEDLDITGIWNRECLWRIVLSCKAAQKTVKVTVSRIQSSGND